MGLLIVLISIAVVWFCISLIPAMAVWRLLRPDGSSQLLDWVILSAGYLWNALSLASWRWFPNDGGFSPAVPSGLGNIMFSLLWMVVGFPAIPVSLAAIAAIWSSGRFSIRMAQASSAMIIALFAIWILIVR